MGASPRGSPNATGGREGRPVPAAYWVEEGKLLAGAYPSSLRRLREAGITLFVDLTEEGEYGLASYEALLESGVRAIRKPVADFSCPRPEEMAEILDLLEAEIEAGSVVYLHCYGGRGRTGTVVGCWLVRRGATGEEAFERIRRLRAGIPGNSPETEEQRRLVLSWSALDPRARRSGPSARM